MSAPAPAGPTRSAKGTTITLTRREAALVFNALSWRSGGKHPAERHPGLACDLLMKLAEVVKPTRATCNAVVKPTRATCNADDLRFASCEEACS